ncbi:hypothetical protein DFJ58DRAFT_848853 [Suillus subalutaceus]|uniref:uncharacterized protein n=1 Tax=Suillus subalutaceus TaxID=48586 RepID=UPI001B883EC2|nr:uncharacterized protein DFJ58DRAFT_848853 [Suillus subalutaceus]KAG1829022.1 hypothetical protein DFJ58DRAFT_848853 [Suillus subalutaceus]
MQSLVSEEASATALAVSKDGDDLEWTCEDDNGNMHDDEDVLGHTTDLYHIPQAEDFPGTLQAIPDVDPGTGIGTPTTTREWFNDHLHTESELRLFDEFDSVLGMDELSRMLATLPVPNVIDHSGDTYFPSSNDISYEYPNSVSALGHSLPIQDPNSDYIYYDKLADLFQGLDFSYSDNRALSEPAIPPSTVPYGAVLHDELPRLPAVPEPTIPPSIAPSGAVLHDELPRLPAFPEYTIPPSIVPSGSVAITSKQDSSRFFDC